MPSHKLMLRAGLIRRLGSGLYTWMPLGLRVLRKVEQVVREEMNRAGALEILAPPIQPAELWQETGRWDLYGPMMLRIKDRAEREFCYAPTAEEVLVRHRAQGNPQLPQLPVNLYQIQTKFRDEIRPRFGVMRAREFIMKDAYSFDADFEGLQKSYKLMYDAYARIFTRLGLKFRAVAADSGEIGGTGSHEFQVLAGSGEDAIAYSHGLGLRRERGARRGAGAEGAARRAARSRCRRSPRPASTPAKRSRSSSKIPIEKTVKSIVVMHTEGEGARARRDVHAAGARRPHAERGEDLQGAGAEALPLRHRRARSARASRPRPARSAPSAHDVKIVADRTVAAMSDFCTGANEDGFHMTGVNWGRDLPEPHTSPTSATWCAGDPSPDGKGTLEIARGIEVGPGVPAAHHVLREDGRQHRRREGRERADRDGLLRHRHHAHRRRRHRAEPRRARASSGPIRWRPSRSP